MDQHILVPFDGSTLAEGVLARVQALAKHLGAELVLLRVVFTPIFAGADAIQAQVARCRSRRRRLGSSQAAQPERVRAEVKERYGDPVEEILDHVAKDYFDLIATATRGRTGLTPLVIGSVATHALRRTSVPLLLRRAVVPQDT